MLLLFLACTPDGKPPGDLDGDGWVAADDCDDTDAAVHPDAVERCDGVDEDCDGAADEDAVDVSTWHADGDADGYGDPTTLTRACDAPVGWLPLGDDCDDTDAAVHPGVAETCDGVDQDCDGEVDEDATDADTWFADADGDTFGDPAASSLACSAPAGAVADATDCDDTRAAVNPDATEVCDGLDDDCDGAIDEDAADAAAWYADADADGFGDPDVYLLACTAPDGFVSDASDCDDARAETNPAAFETCDGLDDDCDGLTDEDAADAASWYGDADGDGHGDAGLVTLACSAPTGTVADATDCDDAEPDVFSGADETCDDRDQDCDGLADEDAVDASTWYADADADGYGDAATPTVGCDAPTGTVADAADCDDAAADVSPGADETCDGRDEDCDGLTDEDAVDAATWYADADTDGYGDADSVTHACEAPTDAVADDADCDDTDADVHPGASDDPYDGIDSDCDGADSVADVATTWLFGAEGGLQDVGVDVAISGDLDGDGVGELIAGAPDTDSEVGAVVVLAGSLAGEIERADATWEIDGESEAPVSWASGDMLGEDVAAGDLDGDGVDDLVVSARGYDWGHGAAAVYLSDGALRATGTLLLSDADAVLRGPAQWAGAGSDLDVIGDLDGDGVSELAVGVSCAGTSCQGALYIVRLPTGAADLASVATWAIDGVTTAYGAFGHTVAGLGDTDGDGLDDVAVGAPGTSGSSSTTGAAYVFTDVTVSTAADATAILTGEVSGDLAGRHVASAGDADGDGYADLLVSAQYYDPSGSWWDGAAYLVRGPVSGTVSLADADAAVIGAADDGGVGRVASAGDVDADGTDDLLVGAFTNDAIDTDRGAVFVALSPISGRLSTTDLSLVIRGSASDDDFGWGLASGDVEGDGVRDLLLGGPLHRVDGRAGAGSAWLVPLSP